MVNALALEADEGRDKQRYASGSSKYTLIRSIRMRELTNSNTLVSHNEHIVM